MDKAYVAAQKADYAIVCVGNHVYGTDTKWKYSPVPSDGREAVDRKALSLEQEDLVKVVHKANPNTIMVLVSSFPFAVNWAQENLPAIVHISSSQELGNGLADVIFGKYNPAGRTTQTWVKSIEDLPPMMDYDIRNGRTYMYTTKKPLYPFGYGLSYSTFEYSNLKVTQQAPLHFEISFDVENTGKYDGEEVAQLYIRDEYASVVRALRQLKHFKRFFLKQGEKKTIVFTLVEEDLSIINQKMERIVEPGSFQLMIGAASDDIRLSKTISVK